ncbi:FAD-dependent oxidoreductase [Demequina sp.]|uniref:FAD-dependent oxidoreductase n=1 Tax=Demequina sp. TaxID=2050685 RepID=UPI0025BFAD1B|nr:FAD-dependent oxidoreductase [Demequina sp.]
MASIGVIGGGILGTLCALLATERGYHVTIVEQDPQLWRRASRVNEGKIHLGPIFALGDEATHRLMVRGALAFAPVVERAVGHRVEWDRLASDPFRYLVMEDSLASPEELAARYAAINRVAADVPGTSYLGRPLDRVVDTTVRVDDATGLASFDTTERAVDPELLAEVILEAVRDAGIRVSVGVEAIGIEEDSRGATIRVADGPDLGPFDMVVNATWEGQHLFVSREHRHALNYRVKAAVRMARDPDHRTVTMVHGPYGDVVRLATHTYMSWYPSGRILHEWGWEPSAKVGEALASIQHRTDITEQILDALRSRGLWSGGGEVLEAIGGVILGHGSVDIDERRSDLHARSEFGTTRVGRVVTPHNFKLTTAPLAAAQAIDALGDIA